MKISIVTPVYNDPRINRSLNSIWRQRRDCELESIVIDAASSDETLDIIEKHRDRIDMFISEPDRGIYDGMNKGIKYATGDVVGILNADDWYAGSNVIHDVTEAFKRHPEAGVCYGNIVYVDEPGRISRYWQSDAHRKYKWYWGWRPPHPSFFVRMDIYKRYGVYDLNFPISADYEIQLRFLFKNRVPALHLNKLLVGMSPGGNSNGSISKIIRANRESFRAWTHNQLRGPYLVPLLKPGLNITQLFRRPSRNEMQLLQRWLVEITQ